MDCVALSLWGLCYHTYGEGGSPSYESQIPGAPHKGGYFLDPLFGGEAVPSSGQPQGKRGEAAQSGGLLAVSSEAADQSRKGSGRGPWRAWGVGGRGLGGAVLPILGAFFFLQGFRSISLHQTGESTGMSGPHHPLPVSCSVPNVLSFLSHLSVLR